MRPRRTPTSNDVLRLPGGTEDNDPHVHREIVAGVPTIASVWEPDPAERAALSAGANLELVVWGTGHPPVSLGVTREQPTSRPTTGVPGDHARVWIELDRHHAAATVAALQTSRAIGDDSDDRQTAARIWDAVRNVETLIANGLEYLRQAEDGDE